MIICASRRTDIPAFHSEWFMERLRAGYCLVRNPVSRTTVYRVDLTRSNVDCIEFITKDPRPMVPHLREIGSMGHMYLFQVTLTPYGRDLEPGIGSKADINDACIGISDRIGRDRMAWRYDPVLFNRYIGLEYHRRKFDMLCREASQWTDRCIFSFIDVYGKLARASGSGLFRGLTDVEKDAFCRMASKVAEDHGMSLDCCCSGKDLSQYGIGSRGCFDATLMRSLDIPYDTHGSPVREGCRCVKAIDIGEYDTCAHECTYCYANRADSRGRTAKVYSKDSELLWGAVMPRDTVMDLNGRGNQRIDAFH